MLALRMRQKDSEFYFVSYPAEELLQKVKFVTRFYGERGEWVGGEEKASRRRQKAPDEVERFVEAIERASGAFQRELNRRKVRQIRDFYRNVSTQPLIPGAVLLFTEESLEFTPLGRFERAGDLVPPRGKFLIIDGQHRLAGLHFYLQEPDADRRIEVPCLIFDGKASEFATEMFVIINSTHTRINKSHLVDLYEKIEWGADKTKKYAARLIRALYEEADSPLRYHINMLGGRSRRDMWINQAQLFTEVHRLVSRHEGPPFVDGRGYNRDRGYAFLRDVLRGARKAFGEAWGDNERYMVTRDVTLKALVRLCHDVLAALGPEVEAEVLEARLAPWGALKEEFRRNGFYERFPAKGPAERVEKIRRRLRRAAGLEA